MERSRQAKLRRLRAKRRRLRSIARQTDPPRPLSSARRWASARRPGRPPARRSRATPARCRPSPGRAEGAIAAAAPHRLQRPRGAAGGPPGATRAGREARFTGAPPPAGDDPARLPRYLVAVIRRASVADHDWIAAIAAEVYGALGDYGTIIRSWLEHPGVLAYLDEVPGEAGDPLRRGFTLVGFYEPAGTPPGTYVADLLAIAVAPAHQRRGVGKGLLEHAIHLAEVASRGG